MIHRFLKLHLKRVAAIILVLCLLLPLSKCTRLVPVQVGKSKVLDSLNTNIQNVTVKKTIIYYPLSNFRFSNSESWLTLFVFVWPVILLTISLLLKNNIFLVLIQILELICCCYTVFFIYFAVLLREPMIGAYVTLLAIFLYLISIFYSFGCWIKSKYQD